MGFFLICSEFSTRSTAGGFAGGAGRATVVEPPKTKKEHCIIAIPSFSAVCKSFLEEIKVYDRLAGVYELPLTLLPLDTDLLSLEDPNCFAVSFCLLLFNDNGIT